VGAVWLVFHAEFRRRWRSWLTLAVLIAVVGGLVLGAAAAGRRTATAFPRFAIAHGFDFLVFNLQPVPGLAKLPDVSSVTTAGEPFNGNLICTCSSAINDANTNFLSLSPGGLAQVTKLIAGRMPDQSSPDQILISVNLEHDFGLHIGSVVRTRFYTRAQLKAILAGANVNPAGPAAAFHVVGIETAESEFPFGENPTYDFYITQAFARIVANRVAFADQYYVRLRNGATDLPRFSAELNAKHLFYTENQDSIATAVDASIHPQAVGWWVLAVLAGLAGLAVVGQALGRQSAVESEEYPTLAALGLPRRRLVALGILRNLFVGLVGAAGAVVVAFVLSPLTPLGEARLAEPSTGFAFDPLILLPGGLLVVAAVLLLGLWPSVRTSRVRTGDVRALNVRPSTIVAWLASVGAPASVVVGVRHALERGRGAASVPVDTALFGTALAVLALCATAVFGASLSHLTATPALYGQDYQLLFANSDASPGSPAAEIRALERDPAIGAIMTGTRQEVAVDGVSVFAVAATAIRGPLMLSTVAGRLPAGDGEVDLGTTTMHQTGARIGSVVRVTVQAPTGGTRTVPFTVVGSASFPGQFGLGGLGTGAAFTFSGLLHAACPPGPTNAKCLRVVAANVQGHAVFAGGIPGPKGQAAIAHFLKLFPNNAGSPTTPISLVNFGQAVNFPLILGFMLALFGVATLLHLLVVSVARRRHEIGLLKALGFVRAQVRAAVWWQATTVALFGIVVGIPLGVATGQLVWRSFATNLGAVPVATVPVWLIAVLGGGVLVVAALLAIAPAVAATRSTTASQLLRTQ
jgi:hypothetical protein